MNLWLPAWVVWGFAAVGCAATLSTRDTLVERESDDCKTADSRLAPSAEKEKLASVLSESDACLPERCKPKEPLSSNRLDGLNVCDMIELMKRWLESDVTCDESRELVRVLKEIRCVDSKVRSDDLDYDRIVAEFAQDFPLCWADISRYKYVDPMRAYNSCPLSIRLFVRMGMEWDVYVVLMQISNAVQRMACNHEVYSFAARVIRSIDLVESAVVNRVSVLSEFARMLDEGRFYVSVSDVNRARAKQSSTMDDWVKHGIFDPGNYYQGDDVIMKVAIINQVALVAKQALEVDGLSEGYEILQKARGELRRVFQLWLDERELEVNFHPCWIRPAELWNCDLPVRVPVRP